MEGGLSSVSKLESLAIIYCQLSKTLMHINFIIIIIYTVAK